MPHTAQKAGSVMDISYYFLVAALVLAGYCLYLLRLSSKRARYNQDFAKVSAELQKVRTQVATLEREAGENKKLYKQERHAARQALELLDVAMEASSAAFWQYHFDIRELEWTWGKYFLDSYLMNERPASNRVRYERYVVRIHPDDRRRFVEEFDQGIQSGQYYSEYRVMDQAGKYHHMRAIGRLIRAEGGGGDKMVGMILDISLDVERQLLRSSTSQGMSA